MISCQNAKIEGLAPVWAAFHGCSAIFDNPGDAVERVSHGVQRIRCKLERQPKLALHRALAEAFASSVGGPRALSDHHLCALPERSFHVTYTDLINAANVGDLTPAARNAAQPFLDRLPGSIGQGLPPLLDAAPLRELLRSAWPVRVRFRELAIGDGQALVAILQPADDESAATLRKMAELRSALDDRLANVGKRRNPAYLPHVSLGYFLDAQAAADVKTHRLSDWNAAFSEIAGGAELQFDRVSLYGFTSMVDFFRAVDERPALKISSAALDRDQRLREKGDRKVAVTELYATEEPAAAVEWDPSAASRRSPVWVTENLEVAYFNEAAGQDRHFHRRACEIYTVLRGTMLIEVEGARHRLQAGESIIVAPGAIHEVIPAGQPFLAMVVAANSGGSADKFKLS